MIYDLISVKMSSIQHVVSTESKIVKSKMQRGEFEHGTPVMDCELEHDVMPADVEQRNKYLLLQLQQAKNKLKELEIINHDLLREKEALAEKLKSIEQTNIGGNKKTLSKSLSNLCATSTNTSSKEKKKITKPARSFIPTTSTSITKSSLEHRYLQRIQELERQQSIQQQELARQKRITDKTYAQANKQMAEYINQQLTNIGKKLGDIDNYVDSLGSDKAVLLSQLQELQSQQQQKRSEEDLKQYQIQTLQHEIQEKEIQISQINSQLQEALQHKSSLETLLNTKNEQYQDKIKQIAQLEQRIQVSQDELNIWQQKLLLQQNQNKQDKTDIAPNKNDIANEIMTQNLRQQLEQEQNKRQDCMKQYQDVKHQFSMLERELTKCQFDYQVVSQHKTQAIIFSIVLFILCVVLAILNVIQWRTYQNTIAQYQLKNRNVSKTRHLARI